MVEPWGAQGLGKGCGAVASTHTPGSHPHLNKPLPKAGKGFQKLERVSKLPREDTTSHGVVLILQCPFKRANFTEINFSWANGTAEQFLWSCLLQVQDLAYIRSHHSSSRLLTSLQ